MPLADDDAPTVEIGLSEGQAARRESLLGVIAGLVCWAVLAAGFIAGAFQSFDLRLLDWRFRLRGERPASNEIALVGIDDDTIHAFGGWPLPRDQYALLIQALEDAGARAIGIDLQLPEDNNHDAAHNALLAYVSSQHANLVHAVSFQSESSARDAAPEPPSASLEALRRQGIVSSDTRTPVAASVLMPYPELVEQAQAFGHITVTADPDGAIRRQPPLVRYRDRIYPSMALRMVGVGRGRAGLPHVESDGSEVQVAWDRGDTWTLPLDAEGAVSLDFAGDRRAFPHMFSMIDVLREYQAKRTPQLRERFSGRYVMVGLDSRTEVTEDVGTTPFAAATPLVFIHVNAINDLLAHRFLRRVPAWSYLAALAALAAVMGWSFVQLPMAIAALVAAAGVLLIACADLALLALWSADAPPFAALLLAPAVYAAVTSGRYLFLENRSRKREADIREGRSIEQQFLPEALVGRDLSRYRVIEKLGSGGMGIVYRGRDTRLKRDVALKVLPARALADERTRRRFRREAIALSRLSHPHIAGIFDFDSQDGTDFLVMEFIEGESLSAVIKRGALAEPETLRIMSQVLDALVEAHARSVIHRDLKPENIMLTRSGEAKVLDFGVAMILDSESEGTRSQNLTEVGHMVGTLPYMAPEVLRGERAEARSDLYSLGVVAFEMATGRRPFPNDEPHELMYTVLNQSPPAPRILNGKLSRFLEEIILRMLAKEADDRPASAAELLALLRTQLRSGTVTDAGATPGAAASQESRGG
ncbi:MAG: serine/threonine-protein kinase [Candidatus Eiseniibacteriota bacterium]